MCSSGKRRLNQISLNIIGLQHKYVHSITSWEGDEWGGSGESNRFVPLQNRVLSTLNEDKSKTADPIIFSRKIFGGKLYLLQIIFYLYAF